MDDRTQRLGQHTAQTAPAWAIAALGPVPADPAARQNWAHKATPIAAYREMYGYDHPGDPIGPEPSHQAPDQRAAWHQAFAALGPADGPDVRAMPDGRLWLLRDSYAAQTAWAPRHVGKQLRLSRLGAFDAELGRRHPDQKIEPLRSGEPAIASDTVREQLHPALNEKLTETAIRIRDLIMPYQAPRAEMDEHPGPMAPGEDLVRGDLGGIFPTWQASGPDAILQPPKPEIVPSARILQLAAEHDTEPDREAAD
jgi:hypothetical protein